METNYFIGVINAAVSKGFEFETDEPFINVATDAEAWLIDNEPYGHDFERIELECSGSSQYYTWLDEGSGSVKNMSGEIFDFNTHQDGVFFHEEVGGDFTPVKWFDVPMEGVERKRYIFVFAKEVRSDGTVAYLYDYFM